MSCNSSRAGESYSEARGNISFEGPIGPENTSGGGGGGSPLRLARRAPYYTLGPGVSNPPPPLSPALNSSSSLVEACNGGSIHTLEPINEL